MTVLTSIISALIYLIATVGFGATFASATAPWVFTLLSLVFVLVYWWLVRRVPVLPIALVFLVTEVVPIAGLIVAGLPVYKTWPATLVSVLTAFEANGEVWSLGFFAPLVASIILASLLGWRPRKTDRP